MEQHPWVIAERKFYENKFEEITKILNFSSYKIILDYGSGTGGFSSILAEKYPNLKVIAIDSNPKAIELAKRYYSHISNLKFEISNALPDDKFDLIIYHLVLHELAPKGDTKIIKQYLEKAYSKLNANGEISILENKKVSKKKFKELYNQNKDPRKGSFDEEYKEHNKYTLKQWEKIFEDIGFKKEYIKELPPNLFIYTGKKKK